MQALFLLAFAIGLRRARRARAARPADGSGSACARCPLAVLAAGSVYAYSFPGLLVARRRVRASGRRSSSRRPRRPGSDRRRRGGSRAGGARRRSSRRRAVRSLIVARGRADGRLRGLRDLRPPGAGLGNLFDRLSPLEALGIWPSGDFRLEPGDGAVPGDRLLLGRGVRRRGALLRACVVVAPGERALPAALAAAALLWLYSLVAGTPYQEAKALVLAAPLGRAGLGPGAGRGRAPALLAGALPARGRRLQRAGARQRAGRPERLLAGAGRAAARARRRLGGRLAPAELLDDQHGRDYLLWELRGNRVCVDGLPAGKSLRRGPSLCAWSSTRMAPSCPRATSSRRATSRATCAAPTYPTAPGPTRRPSRASARRTGARR